MSLLTILVENCDEIFRNEDFDLNLINFFVLHIGVLNARKKSGELEYTMSMLNLIIKLMFCGVKHKSNEKDSHIGTTELGKNLLSNDQH